MSAALVVAVQKVNGIHAARGKGSEGFRTKRIPRAPWGILACLAVLLLVAGCSGVTQGGAQTSTRPNVVFILADDMRADDFEHMQDDP